MRRFPKSAVGLANEKTEVSAKYNNQHYVHMNVAVSTLTILGTGHYLSPGGGRGWRSLGGSLDFWEKTEGISHN